MGLRLAGVVALALVLAGGCGRDRTVPDPDPEAIERELARIASAETVFYWPGRSAEGHPLTHAELQGRDRAFFGYGTCELPEGEGGCAVPAQVQNFPFRASDWRRAVGCTRVPAVRGVPAVHHDTLVLFTRSTVVKIYAPRPRRVAAALHEVGGPASPGPLPPPAPGTREVLAERCK